MSQLSVHIDDRSVTAVSWQNHLPLDIWHRRRSDGFQMGMIFVGRVVGRNRQLGCAVDIGDARPALLTARKCPGRRLPDEGAAVIVQIDRAERDDKGARVRMMAQIAGPHLIYCPFEHGLRPSRRLGKVPDDIRDSRLARHTGGFLLRHHAARVDLQILEREAARLMGHWRWMCEKATTEKPPYVLSQHEDPSVVALMTDALGETVEQIVPSDLRTAANLRSILNQIAPEAIDRLQPPEALTDLTQMAGELTETEVLFGNSGRLWLEQTRAATVIDVDGGRTLDPLAANIAAAKAIVRQCRLRRIGGLIIIDFIDLARKSDRETLQKTIVDLVASDPAMTEVLPISRFGIVQMRRQYYGQTLETFLEDWGQE